MSELHRLPSLCVCVHVCARAHAHMPDLQRPAFTSHTQIFTSAQLPPSNTKLWLGRGECVLRVFVWRPTNSVYVWMCECTVYACIFLCLHVCVQRGRIVGPTGTTWVNNGSFIPLERLTGLCVSEQPHTNTLNQTGNTLIHTHTHTHTHTQLHRNMHSLIW